MENFDSVDMIWFYDIVFLSVDNLFNEFGYINVIWTWDCDGNGDFWF